MRGKVEKKNQKEKPIDIYEPPTIKTDGVYVIKYTKRHISIIEAKGEDDWERLERWESGI